MCASPEQIELARADREEADRLMAARRNWLNVQTAYKGYRYDGEYDPNPEPDRLPVWSHIARRWDGQHLFTIHGPRDREMTEAEFRAAVDQYLEATNA